MSKFSIPFAMPLVVLCGGRSSRMGRLKQDLVFGSEKSFKRQRNLEKMQQETLANFQVRHFQTQFSKIYFSAKVVIPNAFGVETILDSNTSEVWNGKNCLIDLPKEQFAPIFGLQSALKVLQSDVFVLSIDTPFFDYDCVELILQSYVKNHKPTFARNSKIHPLLGVYTLESLQSIQAQIKQADYKLMRLLDKIEAQFVNVSEEKTQNLNTPEDYKKALEQINSQLKE